MANASNEFFARFEIYNITLWPMIIVTYILGIIALILAIKKIKNSNKIISIILAFLWCWAGIFCLMIFLGPIDQVRYIIQGMIWVVQAILLLYLGVYKDKLSFKFERDTYSIIGALMIIYGLVIYPIVGALTGHPYPAHPIFGTACCPVCIFTFGLLMWTNKKVPIYIALIPLFWAITSGLFATLIFNVYADIGEFIIGIVGFILILYRNSTKYKE